MGMESNHSTNQENTDIPTHSPSFVPLERATIHISPETERALGITITDKARVLAAIIYDIVPKRGERKTTLYVHALKALNELNKMQGHYLPTQSLKVTVDATKDKLLEAKRIYDEVW